MANRFSNMGALALIACGLASLLLWGCEPDKAAKKPEETPIARAGEFHTAVPKINPALLGHPATLTIWLASDYASAPVFKDLNAAFEKAYPGVTVKMLGVPWEEMPTKVKTAIIGGNPPDIAHNHPFSLGAQGFAEPLDDLWAAWGKQKQFLPGALDDATWDDHLYGVPLDINCTVLVYNQDLLAQHHVAEPGPGYSFTRWRADLQHLTNPATNQYGIGLSTDAWHTYAFIRANGGDVLKIENGKIEATLDDPKTVAAVRFLANLGLKDHVGPTPSTKEKDYEDGTTLFTMGKVGMLYTGPWDFATIRKNAPNLHFGVAQFPAGLDGIQRGSVQGGGGLFVPTGAAHRELAFEWMKWAVSDSFALRLAREQGRYPVKISQYADQFFKKDPAVSTFIQALPEARPYKLEAFPQANQAFMEAVKASFYGADPAVELAKAQKVAQLAIDAQEGQE